ncbi:MAG: MXAN_2562 family outer membrane beta-barrel protein, partial [Deltaproteobacteria bacterium]|nr:MXAN_2562 family outer membrane beta-barrel protein [Deltaproteobacteria bacterium]
YYINVDSSSKSAKNQISSGAYNGGEASLVIYATDILSHANNTEDGDKEIYILIEAQESEDAGSSSPKFQDNIKALVVHFDRVPPPVPSVASVVPGENNLNVYLNWGANSSESDKYGFNIYWRKSGTSDEPSVSKNVRTTTHKITGLINNISYDIWAEQIDKAKNVSGKSPAITGTPREVFDYYEYYKNSGGKEEGGFCFIATAVYGSPAHPIVYIFKAFRDTYLVKSAIGQKIISLYYRFSPPAADFIRERPVLRFAAALFLTPVALLAFLSLKPVIPVTLLISVLFAIFFIKRRQKGIILPLIIMFLITPLSLYAESERTFGISVNAGNYKPSEIDKEDGLSAKPYKDIFNDKSELMFKLGFDYEVFQRFGTLSAGGMSGFWQVLGKGIYNFQGNTSEKSPDTTVFNIVPLELNLTYRFDYYAVNANIPFVPYIKGGLDYYIYWITDSRGDVSRYQNQDGKTFEGYGGKTGYHYAAGMMFLLDWIDRETASDFDMEFGVNNSYIFVEFYKSVIDGFGSKGFNLSDKGLFFGLYLDI